jgi:signal transduction histidine kinase
MVEIMGAGSQASAFTSAFIWPILKDFVRISYTHRSEILLASIVVASFCAVFLLSSKEAKLLAGKWVDYIGWAFAAFGFQYFFRFIQWMIPDPERLFPTLIKNVCDFLATVCSGANNLFFLAAACVLLTWKRPFMRRDRFIGIILATAVLTLLANSYFVKKGLALPAFLLRLPDSTLSACCLGFFGYATMRNFISRHRQYWAVGALLIGLVYGSIQLVYAANPYLAEWQDAAIQSIIKGARYDPKPRKPVEYLDGAVFATALPLKFLLFVPSSYLFFTLIVAAHDFRKVLRTVAETKQSYLSDDGIVQAIGEGISADVVELFIKLPGTQQQRAWLLSWRRKPDDSASRRQPLPLGNGHKPLQKTDSLLKQVIETGIEICSPALSDDPNVSTIGMPQDFQAFVMLPVKFQGGVVGCLKVSFEQRRNFNFSVLQQLRSLADLLAPAVQDYRALASLDQISYRVARLQVKDPRMRKDRTGGQDDQSKKTTTDLQEAIRNMADILHDVLSPLALEVLVEAGFKPARVLTGDRKFHRALEGQEASYEIDDQATEIYRPHLGKVKAYLAPLAITPREDGIDKFLMGNLILVLPNERDAVNRPSFGSYDLHRRAIASHAADALLDVVRDYFSHEVKELSVRLNAEALTEEAWFREIKETAQRVGLVWGAVTKTGSTKILWGDACAEKIIHSLNPEDRLELESKPLSCVVHTDRVTQTHHVMKIKLKDSGHDFWAGIAREGFGAELEFYSPWWFFLDSFADIAGSALKSLFEIQASKDAIAKMAERRGVMNIAITTGHLMHQLANKVDEQSFSAESLWSSIQRHDLQINSSHEKKIAAILDGARKMKQLTTIFKDVTKIDLHRPCSLNDAVQQAIEFYDQIAKQDRIKIANQIEGEIRLDVSFDVVYFALANLIGNAREAIKKHLSNSASRSGEAGNDEYTGRIWIEAGVKGNHVMCYVNDNGPGIPPEVVEKLYTLGGTNQPGHNGWGLYFTQSSLKENGCDIELVESRLGLTRFAIRFLKA